MAFAIKLIVGSCLLVLGAFLLGLLFITSAWISLPSAPKSAGVKLLAWGLGLIAAGIAVLVIP